MSGGGPPGITRLAHSPFADQGAQGEVRYADMTIYAAESGALVFAAGSIQWSWGLDAYNAPAWHTARASEAAQRITRTVLDRMLRTPTAPRPPAAWFPSPVVLIAAAIAIAFVLRAYWHRMGRNDG